MEWIAGRTRRSWVCLVSIVGGRAGEGGWVFFGKFLSTAKDLLNKCCEWLPTDGGKTTWMITRMPWDLPPDDGRRSQGPCVDTRTSASNLKMFGHYLYSDETIMHLIWILGRLDRTVLEWYNQESGRKCYIKRRLGSGSS